jgi:alkanesulfonate monooxygenase SsuD/methylene tetrahydromethanopterin reductase-like flavin-dependent oxidoreductase (luciferase family)
LTRTRISHIFTWTLPREVDVKFGYYILNTYVPELDGGSREIYAKWLEQIDAAEALDFDSLWVTEHHFRHFGGQMPSPSLILAAASQRTKKNAFGRGGVDFADA